MRSPPLDEYQAAISRMFAAPNSTAWANETHALLSRIRVDRSSRIYIGTSIFYQPTLEWRYAAGLVVTYLTTGAVFALVARRR